MQSIEAIYRDGAFRPLGDVHLSQNQHVILQVEPIQRSDARTWLDEVKRLQDGIVARHGTLSDSTPDIAEDRLRDV